MPNPLYNVGYETAEEMNLRAHPGGGTNTLELRSGEGLVEDQYEAQLKNMYVAFKEPAVNVLATLAGQLDRDGFIALADRVDALIGKFAEPPAVKLDPEYALALKDLKEKAQELDQRIDAIQDFAEALVSVQPEKEEDINKIFQNQNLLAVLNNFIIKVKPRIDALTNINENVFNLYMRSLNSIQVSLEGAEKNLNALQGK